MSEIPSSDKASDVGDPSSRYTVGCCSASRTSTARASREGEPETMVEKAFVDDARRKRSHIIFVWVGGMPRHPKYHRDPPSFPPWAPGNNIHDELVEEQREEEEQATPWLESSI